MALLMRARAVPSTMFCTASSRRRNTCLPVPGWASSTGELMSGSMRGPRPYTAWYGVLPLTLMNAFPPSTHSART
eukprot:15469041-Alexandrium_andersonii.AAC.1